jgi:predicted ATPase
VGEALAQIEATGEFMLAEEVHRIAGLASLHNGADRDGAEAHFQRSLEFCRKHGTRSFELRTSISLAHLLCDQGKRREAGELLAPVFVQFDEGFDTADLREASEFLKELS